MFIPDSSWYVRHPCPQQNLDSCFLVVENMVDNDKTEMHLLCSHHSRDLKLQRTRGKLSGVVFVFFLKMLAGTGMGPFP